MGFVEKLRQERGEVIKRQLQSEAQWIAEEEAEKQKFVKESEAVGKENRRFLEELKIPEYLQAISDEEQLGGAYVLWWLKHPRDIEPFYDRVSLVWVISYVEKASSVRYEKYISERGGGMASRGVGGGFYPNGYMFRAVNVEGSAEKELLVIHNAHKIVAKPGFHYDWLAIYRGFRHDDNPNMVEQNPGKIILSRGQFDKPEVLEKTLASVYLDTSCCGTHFEVRSTYHKDSWPFDKHVPEQEHRAFSSEGYYAVEITI